MSKIEIRELTKIYDGGVVAVQNANVLIEDGEFTAILGPSGCGKSSTLRMLAGLEEVSQGHILFDDKVVNHLSPNERNVALAFESYALYSPRTVYENIAFPLRAKKVSKDIVKRKVMQIVDALDLKDVLGRKPANLSGGQQQRVSLARALVRDPNVFLLDEPLSHMDSRSRVDMRARIRKIHDELRATTIYVTHDQEEAVALADKVVVMNLGVIQQVGTVDELWNYPRNTFVAGFIGEPSINFFPGEIESKGKIRIKSNEKSVIWNYSKRIPESSIGCEIIVGIRPEKIIVSTKENGSFLEAFVKFIEFQGDDKILTMRWDQVELRAVAPADLPISEDRNVWVFAESDHIHLFDKKSGKSLTLVN